MPAAIHCIFLLNRYVCAGFCPVELVPSPKSQNHEVGVFVEVSVNATERGEVPEVGVAVNPATGGGFTGLTVI